jgi:hypothetical protein
MNEPTSFKLVKDIICRVRARRKHRSDGIRADAYTHGLELEYWLLG